MATSTILLSFSGALLLLLLLVPFGCWADPDPQLAYEEGYFKREHSLVQPYQGQGMELPFWDFTGSTVVTNQYVRLTPDRQSKQGAIWNRAPIMVHNWEILLHFAVHGSGKHLFGDGFALWYTKERNEIGPVFGSRDYFTGLAIFFDTYSNENGDHAHEHPFISAMVNNGSIHYDHDRDGTHSQVAGCHAKFRNSQHDTFVAVSYLNRQLTVMYNFNGAADWSPCFSADDIDLPTGYYLGFSATTGDLADNHDLISVKVYDVEVEYNKDTAQQENSTADQELDWSTLQPRAGSQEAPRPHVDDQPPLLRPFWYRLFSITMVVVLVLVVLGLVGGVAYKHHLDRRQKRFF